MAFGLFAALIPKLLASAGAAGGVLKSFGGKAGLQALGEEAGRKFAGQQAFRQVFPEIAGTTAGDLSRNIGAEGVRKNPFGLTFATPPRVAPQDLSIGRLAQTGRAVEPARFLGSAGDLPGVDPSLDPGRMEELGTPLLDAAGSFFENMSSEEAAALGLPGPGGLSLPGGGGGSVGAANLVEDTLPGGEDLAGLLPNPQANDLSIVDPLREQLADSLINRILGGGPGLENFESQF